jgi:hypothetical protein
MLESFQIFTKICGDIRKSRCTTGINNTCGKFVTGVNYTSGKFAGSGAGTAGVVDTGGQFVEVGGPQIANIFAICGPKFFADLKLPQIRKFFTFLLTNTYLKCSNSNFYKIKNSAKQTCSRFLDIFAIKGGNFFERCFILYVYSGKFMDLQFADSHTVSQKFADL